MKSSQLAVLPESHCAPWKICSRIQILLFVILSTGYANAEAISLTWNINGVTFPDGGVVYGSFDYDQDTNYYSNILISSTVGSAFGGANYRDYLAGSDNNFVFFSPDTSLNDFTGTSELHLLFLSPLTNAGGTVDLAFSNEVLCSNPACDIASSLRIVDLAGSVVAQVIPIPPALWLFGSGLLGLVGVARRKRPNIRKC